jgi:stress-induced morphogen
MEDVSKGQGTAYKLLVVSKDFMGKPKFDLQWEIKDALEDFSNSIDSIKINTMTEESYLAHQER